MEEKELRSKMEEMAEMDTRLYLDPLDNTQVRAYKQILSGAKLSQPVIDFLDVCQYDLTVGVSGKNKGVITYEIQIPQELDDIIVLDASHIIRKLVNAADADFKKPLLV